MGKITTLLLSSVIVISAFSGMGHTADVTLQTGFHYDWWDDNKDNKASQAYIPLEVGAEHNKYSFSILTGYATTHVEFPDRHNRTLTHLLDTKLNASYEVLDTLPVDILLGLGINLPTGKTDLDQDDLVLIMDSDLVSINKFGEGYNVNPTVSVAKEWGDWVGGAGVGYLWRGEYDYSNALSDFDPGDIFSTSAEIHYFYSQELYTRLFAHYVWYGKDTVDGEDFYQEGQFFLAGLGAGYDGTKWNAEVNLRRIFRDKSKFQDSSGGIFTEDRNNHGDEWIGDITARYFMDGKTTLNSSLQALYISENDYSDSSSFFVGRREKFTLGLGASRTFASYLEGGITLKGFVMHDEEAHFPEPRESSNYRGISLIVNITSRFSGI